MVTRCRQINCFPDAPSRAFQGTDSGLKLACQVDMNAQRLGISAAQNLSFANRETEWIPYTVMVRSSYHNFARNLMMSGGLPASLEKTTFELK